MLHYLIILLDETSTSYCHYSIKANESKPISLEYLKAGIRFAMIENLMIQFIYPDYILPQEYEDTIESIDHSKIVPSNSPIVEDADVIIFNHWQDALINEFDSSVAYVLRINKTDLFSQQELIKSLLRKVSRLNIVITDIEYFTNKDFDIYKQLLDSLSDEIKVLYSQGNSPQLNLITDRIMLPQMNNCNAGCDNITLAPDGNFYICPAFYYSDENRQLFNVGDLKNGLNIKAAQLYKLSHAPLCRTCDSYQCKRCIWLNRKTTLDITTPSHEQCVVSHIERNASRELLLSMRQQGEFYPEQDIKEINYLDPCDVRIEWNKVKKI